MVQRQKARFSRPRRSSAGNTATAASPAMPSEWPDRAEPQGRRRAQVTVCYPLVGGQEHVPVDPFLAGQGSPSSIPVVDVKLNRRDPAEGLQAPAERGLPGTAPAGHDNPHPSMMAVELCPRRVARARSWPLDGALVSLARPHSDEFIEGSALGLSAGTIDRSRSTSRADRSARVCRPRDP
jgi:hypothetical protein